MTSPDTGDDFTEATSDDRPCVHLYKYISDEDFGIILQKGLECGTMLSQAGEGERLDSFVSFWKRPENQQAHDEHLTKLYFASATRCILGCIHGTPDEQSFQEARDFTRYGITIFAMLHDFETVGGMEDYLTRQFGMIQNDRDLVLYLKANIECHCLDRFM
jgi:hypothetical protein